MTESRLQALEDIEAIKILKHRYFRGIDMNDAPLLATLFTENVVADYHGGTYHWQIDGRPALLAALAAAFHPQAAACHTGHHPEITLTGPNSAEGVWYLTDIMIDLAKQITTTGSALYRDIYLREDGTWKIARSTYQRVYEQVEPHTTKPNLTYSHLATLKAP